ncbi:MAG: VOC family protein [Methanomicrobiales archaeon]|nr:VOC family protein [Methanomicrobiales archaeon]
MASFHRISTGLWFDNQAEEAAKFYISIFKNSSIGRVTRYGKEGFEFHHKPEGSVMTVEFSLDGSNFVALNGGPLFHFSEAVSFIINCANQEEVDYFWERLSEGGDPAAQQCGWLKDKFRVSWQVVPEEMITLLTDPDTQRAQRVMAAMLPMKKIDLAVLKQAFEQG